MQENAEEENEKIVSECGDLNFDRWTYYLELPPGQRGFSSVAVDFLSTSEIPLCSRTHFLTCPCRSMALPEPVSGR